MGSLRLPSAYVDNGPFDIGEWNLEALPNEAGPRADYLC